MYLFHGFSMFFPCCFFFFSPCFFEVVVFSMFFSGFASLVFRFGPCYDRPISGLLFSFCRDLEQNQGLVMCWASLEGDFRDDVIV